MDTLGENKPKITIVIPVYNAEPYLRQCLESVQNQTYTNLEIICIDDGSTDLSLDILRSLEKEDARIRVYTKPNGGISHTRNYARELISGKYVMYLDSDDWIDLDTCENAIKKAQETNAEVVFWNYVREFKDCSKPRIILGDEIKVFADEEVKCLQRRFLGLFKEELKNPESANSLDTVWGKLYKSEIIKNNGLEFVDLKLIGTDEDGLFNLHYFEFVSKAVYLPNCFNHYRKTDSTITKKYKPDFIGQWDNLHSYMRDYVDQSSKREDFYLALDNRISLSIIGLGLNVLRAGKNVKKVKEIKKIICSPNYRKAIKKLEIKYLPLHWKVLFILAKCKMAFSVYLMLKCIKKLKKG